jgi:hypothetical protein
MLQREFKEWVVRFKPTGTFEAVIPVNQGGISGKPKIRISQNIK